MLEVVRAIPTGTRVRLIHHRSERAMHFRADDFRRLAARYRELADQGRPATDLATADELRRRSGEFREWATIRWEATEFFKSNQLSTLGELAAIQADVMERGGNDQCRTLGDLADLQANVADRFEAAVKRRAEADEPWFAPITAPDPEGGAVSQARPDRTTGADPTQAERARRLLEIGEQIGYLGDHDRDQSARLRAEAESLLAGFR